MKILFSESEEYYRQLGLKNEPNLSYFFDGMKFYNKRIDHFDIFICAFYTMPHNVLLTNKFQALNKKTILCSDGIFEFANAFENPMVTKYGLSLFHPIIQDYFLCVGSNECEYFLSEKTETMKYIPDRMISSFDVIENPKTPKILITTANTAYFNDKEFENLVDLISSSISLLSSKNIDYSVRIFDQCLLKSLTEKTGLNFYNDIENDFETTIKDYTSIITTPSSIAITAMYHQRAVALFVYRDQPMFLQAGWLIPSADILDGILSDFLRLEDQRIQIQNRILKLYLTEDGITDSLKKIIDLEQKPNNENYYVNRNLVNMLNSSFNFNFEWFVRKLYIKIKMLSVVKAVRGWIK